MKWKSCLGFDVQKDLKGLVCINHFASADVRITPKSTTLKTDAVPIIEESEKNFPSVSLSSFETVESAESTSCKAHENSEAKIILDQEIQIKKMTEKIQKMEAELNAKKSEMIHMKKSLKYAQDSKKNLRIELKHLREENLLSGEAVNQFEALNQDDIFSCLINGIKPKESYSPNVREFAMRLHYNSPAAYRTIREKFNNNLPHPKTIAAWYQQSDISGKFGLTDESLERLKKIVSDMNGKPLVCSLIFDEIYIRKQVFWNNATKGYEGFINYGYESGDEKDELPKATQALVFMLSGLNFYFQFPLAYYFIKGLNGAQIANLLKEIITKVTECGVTISNLTFDGCKANPSMCKLLGGDLNVSSANTFRPYIENPVNKEQISIVLDPPHMEK